jgi:hypothetical protein
MYGNETYAVEVSKKERRESGGVFIKPWTLIPERWKGHLF